MAETSQLLAAMDRLWFRQIVLSSEPTSVLSSSDALQSCTSSSSESSQWEVDFLSTSSLSQNDYSDEVEDKRHNDENRIGRKKSSRKNSINCKNRSQLSSPSIERPKKSSSLSTNAGPKLQIFSSCSRLQGLELEELKGFMDLGFQFEKDQLSPRTVRVIPGLQRVEENFVDYNNNMESDTTDEGEKKKGVKKPYLSEAWMVKRPDSPLLRLRMARVSKEEEMRECLKVWARTVASTVQSD